VLQNLSRKLCDSVKPSSKETDEIDFPDREASHVWIPRPEEIRSLREMTLQCKSTFTKRLNFPHHTDMPHVTATVTKMHSLAVMFLFHSCFLHGINVLPLGTELIYCWP